MFYFCLTKFNDTSRYKVEYHHVFEKDNFEFRLPNECIFGVCFDERFILLRLYELHLKY